jgi:4-hydroxyphenylpyruvate dioxygenase
VRQTTSATEQEVSENENNYCGLKGIAFLEFSSEEDFEMGELFKQFGFSKLRKHNGAEIDLWKQNDIVFLWNRDGGFAEKFRAKHGPSICGMGFFVEDAGEAFQTAIERGATAFKPSGDEKAPFDLPAVYGIGDSLIYFIDEQNAFFEREWSQHPEPELVDDKGFLTIDHLTNNVYKGTLEEWSDFYKDIFGFSEVRHFDIRGEKTGLFSYALRSPDGSFCIPINEGTEEKSQIEEYLREYDGPGIQHIAFLSEDLVSSMDAMECTGIEFLDIDDEYYEEVFDRVPNVSEDHQKIHDHNILVDGDDDGYLLQIFTKNLVGPIFIELIQRENHYSFGEGNFGALFRSIERDQEKRGVL